MLFSFPRFARNKQTMEGVTLLEIMLVLAIASMIIVMSVRYYQSANQAQQANSFIEQVQGITATVENIATSGSYGAVDKDAITPLLPNNAFSTPWGGSISYTTQGTGFGLGMTPPPSVAVCILVRTRLQSDRHYQVAAGCGSIVYNTTL